MTDFTGVGLHCAAENCNQQDFLPFTCDCCNGECDVSIFFSPNLPLVLSGTLLLMLLHGCWSCCHINANSSCVPVTISAGSLSLGSAQLTLERDAVKCTSDV